MQNLILLGFHVGDQYFESYSKGDAFPQVAAYKLEKRFLESLRSADVQVKTVASIAVSTFPRIKRIWFPAATIEIDGHTVGKVLPLLNLPVIKMASRFIGSFFGLLTMGREADAICVYAAHSPNLLATFLYSKLTRKPYYVYIPDLPSYMDVSLKRSWLLRGLKKLDVALLDKLLSAAAGLLVISKPMIEDTNAWRHKPYIVLEGIAETTPVVRNESTVAKPFIFYAGGINQAYGVLELVEGFIRSGIDYELLLCGRGDLEDYLASVSSQHPSVKYLGFLSPDKVAQLQSQAAFLALTRDPAEKYTRYSFPSKLIEYIAAGIPVLTTRLAGIPDEYFDYLNVIEDFSVESIANALKEICSASQEDLSRKSARGREWLLDNKSCHAVGERVVEFMEKNM
ncbi:glycosyltransferase [Serratia sp. D1N4]